MKRESIEDLYTHLVAIRSEKIAGSSLNSARRLVSWRFESNRILTEAFLELARTIGCRTLIECGAHAAESSVEFINQGGDFALAIEANPATYQRVTIASSVNGVTTLNAAVSSYNGKTTFFVPTMSGSDTPGNASLLTSISSEVYSEVEVSVVTLDSEVSNHDAPRPMALWIDVEGASLNVLQGTSQLLSDRSVQLIFLETEIAPFWEDQSLLPAIIDFLHPFGFQAILRDDGSEQQFNVIFIHNSLYDDATPCINAFWKSLANANVEVHFRDIFSVRATARYLKHTILRHSSSRMNGHIHRLAAFLGSTSSRASNSRS